MGEEAAGEDNGGDKKEEPKAEGKRKRMQLRDSSVEIMCTSFKVIRLSLYQE